MLLAKAKTTANPVSRVTETDFTSLQKRKNIGLFLQSSAAVSDQEGLKEAKQEDGGAAFAVIQGEAGSWAEEEASVFHDRCLKVEPKGHSDRLELPYGTDKEVKDKSKFFGLSN